MKRIFLAALAMMLVGASGASFASGHGHGNQHGDRHDNHGNRPEFVNELAPLSVCGTFVGGNESLGEGTGFQTSTTTYDYGLNSPLGRAAGDAVDFHWVHDAGPVPGPTLVSPLVWDFGSDVKRVRLFPSIDHGPVPGEALEVTVYSSDSPTGPWAVASQRKVYVPGWNPGWIADDYVSEWRLRGSDRYVAVKWGGPGALLADGDAEIDAMCSADDSEKGHGHEWDKKGWGHK